MKKFLKLSVIFVLIVVLAVVGLELLLSTQTNNYSYKRKYIEEHRDDIKVLFLGHSLISVEIIPSLIGDSVFNGAITGTGGVFDNSITVQLAERYVPQMKNLKMLVVPFSYRDVYRNVKKNDGKFDDGEAALNTTSRCMAFKYLGISVEPFDFIYWSEILNSRYSAFSRFKKSESKNRQCDELGYQIVPAKPVKDSLNLKEYDPNFKRENAEIVVKGFLTLGKLCKENNVKLVILAPPLYTTQLDQLNDKWKSDFNYVIDKAKSTGADVEFCDYSEDTRFVPEDFKDACHLNDNGAKKLSVIFKDEILEK